MTYSLLSKHDYLRWLERPDVIHDFFASPQWVQVYDDQLLFIRIESGQTISVIGLYQTGMTCLKSVITPPLIPWVGYATDDPEGMKVDVHGLKAFLRSLGFSRIVIDFPPSASIMNGDLSPELFRKYTYREHLPADSDELLQRYSSKTRNLISKANRLKFSTEISDPTAALLPKVEQHFEQKGIRSGRKYLRPLLNMLSEGGEAFVVTVNESHKELWLGVFVINDKVCYYLFGMSHPRHSSNAGNAFGIYSAMTECIQRSIRVFDFEGSSIPGVERFIKGFGAERTEYFSFRHLGLLWKWIYCFRRQKL